MVPTNIRKKDASTLQIDWDDGHVSLYTLAELRRQCPCASCREARSQTTTQPLRVLQTHEVVPPDLDVRQADVVGRYAVNFLWNDGHHTGIYTFKMLRELCQCNTCQVRRNPAQPVNS